MGFVQQYAKTAKSVFTSPSKTLKNERRTDPTGFAFKFALTSLALTGIIQVATRALETSASIISLANSFAINFVGGLVGLAVIAIIYHVFVYLLGGRKGYGKTIAAVFYGTATMPVANLILLASVFVPALVFLGLIVGIWTLQIEYRGIQHFQEMNATRAGLSIIIPILLIFGAVLAAAFYFASLMPTPI